MSLYGVENVEELSNKLYSEICSETLVKLSKVEKEKKLMKKWKQMRNYLLINYMVIGGN